MTEHPDIGQSIVRIRDGLGAVCGVGFLVTEDLVCTCTHVVARALFRPTDDCVPVGTPVSLDFPYLDGYAANATVACSHARSGGDIAILRLSCPPPTAAAPVRLVPAGNRGGEPVVVLGFPAGNTGGAWVHARLSYPRTDGSIQVTSTGTTGYAVQPGFSGSPVWSLRRGGVVGMIRDHHVDAITAAAPSKTAVMVPSEQLDRLQPGLLRVETAPVAVLTAGLAGLPGSPRDSVEQYLHQYLGTDTAPAPFGGRDTEIGELDRWLGHRHQPFAVMTAPAGRGKSALVAHWAADLVSRGDTDVALVPVSLRLATAAKHTVVGILGSRLCHIGDQSVDDRRDPETWLTEISLSLRRDRPADRKLVVIIDGADEAAGWALGRDLKFVTVGSGVKVLVVARHTADRDSRRWAEELHWSDAALLQVRPLNDDGVRQAVISMGASLAHFADTPDVLAELTRLCEGDPLMVGLWLTALHKHVQLHPHSVVTAETLHEFQPGMAGVFAKWLEDQRVLWHAEGRNPYDAQARVMKFFHLCARSLGPLTLEETAELGTGLWTSTELLSISRDAERFIVGDGNDHGWVFSHPRLSQYFDEHTMVDADRIDWEQRFLACGQRALDRGNMLAPKRTYAVRHYGEHLTRAFHYVTSGTLQIDPRLVSVDKFNALVTPAWQHAWLMLTGAYDGFLTDLERAWNRAHHSLNELLSRGELTEAGLVLAGLVRLLLVRSSVHSLTVNVSGPIVVALLDKGTWSPQQALAFSRGMTAVERAIVLVGVARAAPELIDEVLSAAQKLCVAHARMKVIAAVGLLDVTRREQLRRQALSLLTATRNQPRVADTVAALLPLVGDNDMDELTQIVRAVEHPQWRAQALVAIASARPEHLRHSLLAAAVDAANSVQEPDTSCELFLQIADLTADREQKVNALAHALSRAHSISTGNQRLYLLLAVSARASAPHRLELQKEILVAIGSEELAPHVAVPLLRRLVSQAEPVLLDDLAEGVLTGRARFWQPADYQAAISFEGLLGLSELIGGDRSRAIAHRAMTRFVASLWRVLAGDEERIAVRLLSRLNEQEIGEWDDLISRLSPLGRAELALMSDKPQQKRSLIDISGDLAVALASTGLVSGDLGRVMDYVDHLPAQYLIAPLRAAAERENPRGRYIWFGILAALPRLLDVCSAQRGQLRNEYDAAITKLIKSTQGVTRLRAASMAAPALSAMAVQDLLAEQMKILDTDFQDRTLIALAAQLEGDSRIRWADLARSRLPLPGPDTDILAYKRGVAALLPLLQPPETVAFAEHLASGLDVSGLYGDVLALVLHRMCELGLVEEALAIAQRDKLDHLTEALANSLAQLAAQSGDARLTAYAVSLLGDGYSRARRLLSFPEHWREQNRPIVEHEILRWVTTRQNDFGLQSTVELAAKSIAYIPDVDLRQHIIEKVCAYIDGLAKPENGVDTVVSLLASVDAAERDDINELALRMLSRTADAYLRRRLFQALTPHLSVEKFIELILTKCANVHVPDEFVATALEDLDIAQIRQIYDSVAAQAFAHCGTSDSVKLSVKVVLGCLIRLAQQGFVDECLQHLRESPRKPHWFCRAVLNAIAAHIPRQSLKEAQDLSCPDTVDGHSVMTAPLLLREADFTGPLETFERIAFDNDFHVIGDVLPELSRRLLPYPTHALYRPLTALLRRRATVERSQLLTDLETLAPLIKHLGGEAAVIAIGEAVLEVTAWFS